MTNGVSINSMGSLQMSCFLTEGRFGYAGTPVSLRLYSQECQGVPFSPICQKSLQFAAAPLVLTPFVRNQRAGFALESRGRG